MKCYQLQGALNLDPSTFTTRWTTVMVLYKSTAVADIEKSR